MSGASFIDTNIWVYAHLHKPGDARHSLALDLVENLTDRVISPQVAMEYYSVMLRSRQTDAWIQANLEVMQACCRIQSLNVTVLQQAWQIRNRYKLSIWDSQIVAAALVADCHVLYSEDLQHGQVIEHLQVRNPL